MKRTILTLFIIVSMFIITCGNEPPEGFYEGTPEDSAAIALLLDENADLKVTEDMFVDMYTTLTQAPVEWYISDSFLRDNPTIEKQHCDSCALELTERNDVYDFWFAKDTTCTVYLFDTFDVMSLIHADVKYIGHYDIPIIDTITGETLTWGLGTIDTITTPYYASKDIGASGLRHIFFEPIRDTTYEIDEETGDTTYPFIEPLEWELKRISYGTYDFPGTGTDIPSIGQVVLHRGVSGENDTIIKSSYDTLLTDTTGQHVMNRFRGIDSLIVIDPSDLEQDSLTGNYLIDVEITLAFGTVDSSMVYFFASCGGSNRTELIAGTGKLIIEPGPDEITNLYFESVTRDAYYYVLPDKGYKAQVWLLPVRIGGSQ